MTSWLVLVLLIVALFVSVFFRERHTAKALAAMNRPALILPALNALGWALAGIFFAKWLIHR